MWGAYGDDDRSARVGAQWLHKLHFWFMVSQIRRAYRHWGRPVNEGARALLARPVPPVQCRRVTLTWRVLRAVSPDQLLRISIIEELPLPFLPWWLQQALLRDSDVTRKLVATYGVGLASVKLASKSAK